MLLLDDIRSQQIPPRCLDAKKLLITGPVGVGKTTIAKALAARHMGVDDFLEQLLENDLSPREIERHFPFDFFHINGGDDGIDKIRDLALASQQSPSDPRCRCRAFVIDEIHALPDKAVQALLLPLERDVVNLWVACTSRPRGQLDAALRSRFSCHLDLGCADVRAVMLSRGCGEAEAAAAAKSAQGDLRLALWGGAVESGEAEALIGYGKGGRYSAETTNAQGHQVRLPYFIGDAKRLLAIAVRSPFAVQAALLDALVDYPEQHTILTATLSPRNDVAAHQLLAAARKARLL